MSRVAERFIDKASEVYVNVNKRVGYKRSNAVDARN